MILLFFFVCFVFNVHMIKLQLLVNQECRITHLGSSAKLSRFTSDYMCNHVYIYTFAQKLGIFKLFQSFLSCQYIEINLLEKKIKKSLRDSNLPSLK